MLAAYLPRDLNRVRQLEQLLAVLDPFIQGAKCSGVAISARDAATALNHLKRLQRQARFDDDKAQLVEDCVQTLARRLVAAPDLSSLEAKHVALALNALADRCLGPSALVQDAALQVGAAVPARWEEGRELIWGQWADGLPQQGDVVGVRRSDGSVRLARVDAPVGADEQRLRVWVSSASRWEWQGQGRLSRIESPDALARITLPSVETAASRRAACRVLANLLLESDLVRLCLPQDLATVLWAQARLSFINTRILKSVLERALHPVTLRKARPRDLATMLWSLAELGVRDADAVLAISRSFILAAGLADASPCTQARAADASLTRKHAAVNGQDIANTAWALARLGVCDDHVAFGLVCGAERLVLARDPSMTTQAVSNVLWAVAQLALTSIPAQKGRNWSGRDIRHMCENIVNEVGSEVTDSLTRTKAAGRLGKEWKIQGAATTLWALATLGILSCPLTSELLHLVYTNQHQLQNSDYGQLHQFFSSTELNASCGCQTHQAAELRSLDTGENFTAEIDAKAKEANHQSPFTVLKLDRYSGLRNKSRRAFAATSSKFQTRSEAQVQVARILRQELRYAIEEEVVIPGLGYSVDIMIPNMDMCVEIDGPSHFVTDLWSRLDRPNGPTMLKTALLEGVGLSVVHIKYSEWDSLMMQETAQRAEWLMAAITKVSASRGQKWHGSSAAQPSLGQ